MRRALATSLAALAGCSCLIPTQAAELRQEIDGYRAAHELEIVGRPNDLLLRRGDGGPALVVRLAQLARSAVVTGTRAARNAGRMPPMRPMTSAQITPISTRGGVTAS